jgi:hypothetical protein
MPQLLRLRFCNIGPRRARMDDLTLSMEDITTGQATHSAIWLRNGGGKTTLIRLIFWLLCPDKPMPDMHKIEEYVQPDDHSVLVAEWQMDGSGQQRSLWSGKPERYLTGAFCEWRASSSAQEGRKLHRMFFATRVIEDEPRLTLEDLPIYITKQGQLEQRVMGTFRQELHELDHTYPQASVEYTEALGQWREMLERIGADPELFRYQIRMNSREGGAAEPFLFKNDDSFVDFFLDLMGETATGHEIAKNITTFRQLLLDLRHKLEPEYALLQTLTSQLALLCEVADERARLYRQVHAVEEGIDDATGAVNRWVENLRQEQSTWEEIEQEAHAELLRVQETAKQQRRRALLLRFAASQKRVQQLTTGVATLSDLVEYAKQQVIVWQAAIPLRAVIRARARAESIQAQMREQQQEHEPLLLMLQESAGHYAAALSAKTEKLRAEERHTEDLVRQQRAEVGKFRDGATEQDVEAAGYDAQEKQAAKELSALRQLHTQLENQGILQAGEYATNAHYRWQQQQDGQQKELQTLQRVLETLELEREELQERQRTLKSTLEKLDMQMKHEQKLLKPAQQERQQIAADTILQQHLEVPELDVDQLTSRTTELLEEKQYAWEERLARLRITAAEQDAMIQYLSDYGFLPPLQAVAHVQEHLKKERITAWSGWRYLAESVGETERRSWLQRVPELAFCVVVPDEQWPQAQHTLQTAQPYLETPVVVFTKREIQNGIAARGWSLGPTSDAYFQQEAGNRELLDRKERRQRLEDQINTLHHEAVQLKNSLQRLKHTLTHYPTTWWNEHHALLREAQEQQQSSQAKLRPQEQELEYCKKQIASKQLELRELQKKIDLVKGYLIRLQASEAQLQVDADMLQQREYEQHALAEECRTQAQHLRTQAQEKENEANAMVNAAKHLAEEASIDERERSEVRYLEGQPLAPASGDLQVLRDEYGRLKEQYEQKIGVNELTVLHKETLKEAEQAQRQLRRKMEKPVTESEVHDALSTLSDPDDADQRANEALVAKVNAENERDREQDRLVKAEQEMQGFKKRLSGQGIDENELEDVLESEALYIKEAEEEERLAANNEQVAQKQSTTELEAQQSVQNCTTHIESLVRVQRQVEMMQENHAALLALGAHNEDIPDVAEMDKAPSAQERQAALKEEEIDELLQTLQRQLKQIQEGKGHLDHRTETSSQHIRRALNEVDKEFKEVSLAKRLLAYSDGENGGYEQHSQTLLPEMLLRQTLIQEEREKSIAYRSSLVEHLVELAESGADFLKSASQYSKLPASLPAFERRPFLRIHLSMPVTKDERVGKIADLLNALVEGEGEIPTGVKLLQQAVRRLAEPMKVELLFPDPSDLHYMNPSKLAREESGGERLTSMVLLYCTLLRMRVAHRTKPAGRSSCLILDNPIGVASRSLFLQLQREVAQAMDIQLIYTTGLKDFDALEIFPKLIRLRNTQRNRRTGEALLMHDTSPTGLDAIHMMHDESRNFSREHQDHQDHQKDQS